MQIAALMSRKVETIAPTDSLRHASNIVRDRDLCVLPVGNGDKLVGTIPDRSRCAASAATAMPPVIAELTHTPGVVIVR